MSRMMPARMPGEVPEEAPQAPPEDARPPVEEAVPERAQPRAEADEKRERLVHASMWLTTGLHSLRNKIQPAAFSGPVLMMASSPASHQYGALFERLSAATDKLTDALEASRKILSDLQGKDAGSKVEFTDYEAVLDAAIGEVLPFLQNEFAELAAGFSAIPDVPEAQRTMLDMVIRSLETSSGFVPDVVRRLNPDASVQEPVPIDMPSFIDAEFRGAMLAFCSPRNVKYFQSIAGGPEDEAAAPLSVVARPADMMDAIENLVKNAAQATPAGGKVTVKIDAVQKEGKPFVRIAVADTGAGMDEETKSRLFKESFTTKARGEGTGVGLPSVQRFVNESGGSIEVQSELGKGSTFSLYLPKAAPPPVSRQRDMPAAA